jgi:hypothetical protein
MYRDQVRAERCPSYEEVGPVVAVNHLLRRIIPLIPENAHPVTAVHNHLVSCFRVAKPRTQVFLLVKGFDLRRHVLLLNSTFPSIAVNIRELVDSDGVLLVQRGAV